MRSVIINRVWPLAALVLACLHTVEAKNHHRAGLNPAHIRELTGREPKNVLADHIVKPRSLTTTRKRCRKASSNSTATSTATSKKSASTAKANAAVQNTGSSGCFPALGFNMPSSPPSSNKNWWCDPKTEYAFVGFSYEVSACQSKSDLISQFKDVRNRFNGRYIRLYGACDRDGFYDDVIEAAWEANVGVHALVWFGFDGGNIWQTRRDALFQSLKSNPKAPFVTRVVQFGSEPLFDSVLPASELAQQVWNAKNTLKSLNIPVTVSDMAWSYQKEPGSDAVLAAVDLLDIHTLPYFASDARGGADAWHNVAGDISWFMSQGSAKGKKIIMTENGWPSQSSQGVQPNSRTATTDIGQEKAYFDLLDSQCSYFKNTNGGIAWFAHIYSDDQEPGYGILYTAGGTKKFDFSPRTHC